MHLLLIAAALVAQGGQVVGLAIQPAVGLTDDEAAVIRQKIVDEIGAASMMVVHADAVDPACAPDAGCVEQARLALPEAPSALLVVELIRVGPVVQLSATATAGDTRATGSHALDDAQLQSAAVLPKEVRGWIDALAQQNVVTPPPDEPPPEETPPPAEDGLSPMRMGAFGALGGGALALLAGGLVAGSQEAVLGDATSTGDAKEGARTVGLVGLGVAAVGVVALGGGAALFLLE